MAVLGLFLMSTAVAMGKDKDRDKDPGIQMVDSGSFGVFMNGRRVATETFSIKQGSKGSVVTSEFKADGASESSTQNSELQLNAAGELQKYEWKEVSPGKAQAVVIPNDSFLLERVTVNPTEKAHEHPFMLPTSTSILDDYFFVQREVLAWKYLAIGCRQNKGQVECPANQKTQFGTLNPHEVSSTPVSMEFSGKDKVAIRGTERELDRFTLKTENGDWSMWLDDQFKVVRIVITDANTEVVRV
jgi:hypothetical protein